MFDFILRHIAIEFRWIDVLDIAIVFFIIYSMLVLIRGTRAVQMLTGLVIVGVIYIISVSMELLTVHEILSRFFSYLFIIIIIVFQDDIRRALARVGKTPFFSLTSIQKESEALIEELVKACISLSRKRIGALIVIQQSMGLKDSIEVGVRLDTGVNSELLISVFTPSSPIHDGAVIIHDGRITSAGCFLPLTRNPNIEKSLGTRHRAALGLTEVTDAVVVVISEEQREISFAKDGELVRKLDGPALRKILHGVFAVREVVVNE